ncbi:MAG: DNA topoisomerase [Candidatus Bathyarchaeia archaeon]|nr:DNA topoisomerase III [Candidatus Bathyarchaeota archaeon]
MLVITEKPSVAKNIRLAIKPPPPTLALRGHILELDFPEQYSRWRSVDPRELFNAPVKWTIRDQDTYKELVKAVKKAGILVLATDNDPEGELIAYESILVAKDSLGSMPKYCRMRFNTVTLSDLRHAWENLEPDLKWNWVWKALFRHKFDLITGAAYTRLLTLSKKLGNGDSIISWGSCQMPTLWFVYQREMEIRNFKPEKYYVLSVVLNVHGVKVKVSSEPIKDSNKSREAYALAKTAKYALVMDFQLIDEIEQKPLPTDTDSMLQDLSKITGLSAAKIMSLAESLYGDGYISYPRTETNMWLTTNHRSILSMLSSTPLGKYINMMNYSPRDGKKNDGAHPPIYPTAYYPWSDDKGKVWEYIARRYIANVVGKNAILKKWRLRVDINGLKLGAAGRYFVDEGFYQIFPYFKPKDTLWIPQLHIGEKLPIVEVKLEEKKTKPPPRLTESELLSLLEKHFIGTDATRADYPQIIVERGYAEKKRKSFYLSDLGEALVNLLKDVDERLVTPDTRRYVEQLMGEVELGRISEEDALKKALKIYENLFDKVSLKLKTMRDSVNTGIKNTPNSMKKSKFTF